MPWVDCAQQRLPYQSGSNTSRDGARAARGKAERDRETLRYHYRLFAAEGVTDHEMHRMTGLDTNIITARRNELKAVPVGRRMGPKGVCVTAWALEDKR